MKNRIWVGMNKDRKSYTFTEKLEIAGGWLVGIDGRRLETDNDMGFNFYPLDIYALNLKPLEIVEVIIDTETQKYEVVRPREVGWYLVWRANEPNFRCALAMKWDGEEWFTERGVKRHEDANIRVLCKLETSDYLRSLE
jgi:hypothetical protein